MAYMEKISNDLEVIEIGSSIFKLMTKIKQAIYQLHVEFHKVQYWDHFCSYFYVSDLPNASNIFDPIMLADDTNLFFSNCEIPVLFATVNSELSKINQWFLANKHSLNSFMKEAVFI